ncbi:MAG: hypothetical protein HQK63_07765 [Desulfamplus sp.]|nr:hypothetical protein [Desulfamplus sp.]
MKEQIKIHFYLSRLTDGYISYPKEIGRFYAIFINIKQTLVESHGYK